MVISKETAYKALKVFRKEQKKRTIGTHTGCYCDSCAACMKLAIESVKED